MKKFFMMAIAVFSVCHPDMHGTRMRGNATASRFPPEADARLRALVEEHGVGNWTVVASLMPEPWNSRTVCARRWNQYIDPVLTKDPFSPEEDAIIMNFVARNSTKQWRTLKKQHLPHRPTASLFNRFRLIARKMQEMGLSEQDAILHVRKFKGVAGIFTPEEAQAIRERIGTVYEQWEQDHDQAPDYSIESFQERVRIAREHRRENPSLAAIPPELQERARRMRERAAEILGSTAEG
ncbi:MAG: hypothetical protein LBF84_02960 [Holosporales bacterium]|nr:hypothetical protein [Holosporales bacterium]